jgi:hypothetical protein
MASESRAVEDYRFIDEPPDALKCPVCLGIVTEPWQHGKCGRLFCKKCIDEYGKSKPCPFCKREQPQYFEDTKSRLLYYVCV